MLKMNKGFIPFEVAKHIHDDFCLYADVDVIFTPEFQIPTMKPESMAIGDKSRLNAACNLVASDSRTPAPAPKAFIP